MLKLSVSNSRVDSPNHAAGRRRSALARILSGRGGGGGRASALLFAVYATCVAAPSDAQTSSRFTITPTSVNENAGTVQFSVTDLRRRDGDEQNLVYATKEGTAKAGAGKDYDTSSGTKFAAFSFGAFANNAFSVKINDDMIDEDNEYFDIELNLQGDTIKYTHRITIRDNDAAPTVNLSLITGTALEGTGNIKARATLSMESAKTVTVDYGTVDGTAQAPGDYTTNSGTLTFAPGEKTKDIDVTVENDTDKELSETFDIELTSATNATLGTNKSVTATITQPTGEQIPADCATSEADLHLTRTTSGTSAESDNADFKEGGQAVFRFLADREGPLTTRCDGTPVWLNFEIGAMGDGATFGGANPDYTVEVNGSAVTENTGSIMFTMTSSTQYVVVKSVAESPHMREVLENMTLIFKDPNRLDITGTSGYDATSMSLKYEVVIEDASQAPVLKIQDASGGHTIAENGGTYDFTIELEADPWIVEDVTVECDTVNGTATAGEDYTALTDHVLTFQPSELASGTTLTKTCQIAITDDALDEAAETLTLEISNPTGLATITGNATKDTETLTIQEDASDPAPVATLSATPATRPETPRAFTAGTYSFVVSLDNPTGRENLAVGYRLSGTATRGTASGSGVDYFVMGGAKDKDGNPRTDGTGQLLITKGRPRGTVIVQIVSDSENEPDETVVLELVQTDSDHVTVGSANTQTLTIEDDDAPSVTLTPNSVDENVGTATFTASLDGTARGDVTVQWEADDGTGDAGAVAGSDFTTRSGSLTITTSNPNPTFSIPIIDDELDETAETFDIMLASANRTAKASTHEVTINDNDGPPSISVSPTRVDEDDGMVTFTAMLSEASGRVATVGYETSGGTATEGSDYDAASGTLTFAKGDVEETFTIVIADDSMQEGLETFSIAFVSADGTVQGSTHDVTIVDDELPSVTLTPSSVDENVGTATFTASLNGTATGDVTVEWETENGAGPKGAIAGEDYSARSGTLTITSSNPNPTISIPIANDSLDEIAETFDIELSSANGTARPSTHTVTINDDDEPPSVSVTPTRVDEDDGTVTFAARLASSGRATMVEWRTENGTAEAGEDYERASGTLTFAKGDVEETFTIIMTDDALDEGEETFDVVMSSSDGTALASTHAVTIAGDNDDPPSVSLSPTMVDEDAGRATFAATLSEASGRVATVRYATSDGTARAGTDYSRASGTLTFAKGDIEETFAIEIADNSAEDGDKAFRVALNSPDGTALGSNSEVTIFDDESLPRVTLSPSRVGEGDDKVTFAASLAGRAVGNVTVEWETENGTAEAGEDYATNSGTLKFTQATTNPTLEVRITDDALDENDETFEIEMSSADGTARATSHEVTIADDDPLPELGLAVDRTSVDEGGRVVATATLTPASGREVSVGAVVEDGTTSGRDRTVSGLAGGRLTFAKGDTTETFAVDIVDDPLNELAETFTLRLTNPDGATLGTQVSRAVTIATDGSDPEPSVAFALAEAEVREGEGRLDVEARLSAESGRRVTVDYATADATGENAAVAGEDYAAASGTLAFEPGQTARSFPLEVEADGLEEESEILDVSLSGPVGATLGSPSGMRVTILDGDDPILAPIANYLMARAEALLAQQPQLAGILRGDSPADSTPGFSLSASDDGTRAEGGFAGGRVWGSATGVWSSRDGADRRNLLGTIGAHAELSDDLMLGGLLQFDSVAGDLEGGTGEIRGSGWMAGPYFVASGAAGRLRFEGRLLYGRSSNEIEGFSTGSGRPPRDGSYDGERWLALAGVEGEYRLKSGAVLLPSADLGHAREIAEGFRDSLGREVEGQNAAMTRLRLGAMLEIPVDAARGDLTLRPGLRFVATHEDGGPYVASDVGAEGRIDFGVDYRLDGNVSMEFEGFYSGIGRRDRESYGAGVGLRMDF